MEKKVDKSSKKKTTSEKDIKKKNTNVKDIKKNTEKKVKKKKDEKKYPNKLVYIILGVIIIIVVVIYFVTKDSGVSDNKPNDSNNVDISNQGDNGTESENNNGNIVDTPVENNTQNSTTTQNNNSNKPVSNTPVVNNSSSSYQEPIQNNELLSLGVKMYLKFLWIVDGAFNEQRYNNNKIKVNNTTMDSKSSDFTCTYDAEKEWCKGENFEKNFNSVFAKNITIDDVYGDGGYTHRWYEKREDGYYFNNPTGCDAARMSDNQTMTLIKEEKNKLTYRVSYKDNMKTGIYKGSHRIRREFVLVKEGNDWKVSKAHYHDLCFQDYYIPRNS